ncbi:semaphorin-3C [Erythrolamprus reginae]|uniref:semaphorin-3C n=1 Tax=Erythrolamprus reginae TaxID=121349 RepID=UPI00396CD977
MTPQRLQVLVGLFLCSCCAKGSWQPQPRVFLTFNELQETRTSQFYSLSHQPLDYRILVMDEDQDRIYVGSKDHILSLNINNISQEPLSIFWPASTAKVDECKMAGKDPTHGCGNFVRVIQTFNRTHLYVCGSGAFSPVCAYLNRGRRSEEQVFKIDSKGESGKGRCSFNPSANTVSVMINQGTVQKVVALPTNSSTNGELILEELEVFKNNARITTMAISSKKQQLYVSSDEGVTQVSLHRCHIYGTACADCCLARDPYCAWDGNSCSRFYPTGKRRSRRQDVRHGNPMTQCRGFNLKAYRNAAEVIQYGVKNNTTFLECSPKSPQASIKWLFQKDNDRRKEVKLGERILATQQGLLIRLVQEADRGTYHCIATENGFKQTIAKVNFKVLDSDTMAFVTDKWSPWTWASSLHALQFHPKDLAGSFSHSELQMINQYCKDTRQLGQQADGSSKMRADYNKLKALLNSRKSRNRRNQWPGS